LNVLRKVRAKRGYVLTYHRLLNEISPALLAAYDDFYTQFTLTGRALSPVEKETIWMALIAATRAKPSGRIHVVRARKAGMSRRAIADAVAIGAHCDSLDTAVFAGEAFGKFMPKSGAIEGYLRGFEASRGRVRPWLAHAAAAVAQAGRRCGPGVRLHLARAFKKGARREQIAEGMCYVLMHCGGPAMLDALDNWIKAAKTGRMPAPY
jgi:alkylhydroperoxidase/carboxymuconolactone decarboxylase family protein YurZ